MVEAIYIPSFPPSSPFEAYLYMLAIPLVLRLILVMPPLIDIIQKYSPDRKILWQAVNSLKIKGLWVIIFNEVLAMFLPFILALYARTLFDPIGWDGWDETPSEAIFALIAAGALWLFGDFLRVVRTRRLMRSVSERNRIMVKVAAKGIVHARGVLGFLEKLSIGDKSQQELAASNEASTEDEKPKKSILSSLLNISGKTSGKGAEVANAALGVVRDKAKELTNKMDDQIQRGIQQQSRVAIKLLFRDLAMSIAPIVILVGLYNIW